MIRGSIEVAQRTRVAGWIYCQATPVRESVILAFVGARCVGAGKVDVYRRDLHDAGLDDGFCGFDFPLHLEAGESVGGVVVRLPNSDASLIQPSTTLSGPDDEAVDTTPDLGAIAPASVAWMQDHGMLDQHEYDFLRGVQTLGAYERSLRAPRRPGGEIQPAAVKPEQAVLTMLGLYTLGEVVVQSSRAATISDLAGAESPLRQGALSVAAIWCEERGRITLDERSHTGPLEGRGKVLHEPPPGGIDYSFGPDRLLFLHRDCSFAPASPSPTHGLLVFTATPRGSVRALKRDRAA